MSGFLQRNPHINMQHLQYMPWGKEFVMQKDTSSYNARYTFSGKEKDSETGYSYFGARYYSSDLSVWLSVDPMSDKYPSLSPYVYCANNPVKLVDPNGEEVIITGDQADAAFNSLQQGTNLDLSINEEGKISASGKPRNDNDRKLQAAIQDASVTVRIVADSYMPDPDNEGGSLRTIAGHCYGASYNGESGTATATNYVNVAGLSMYEKPGAEGAGMMHEVTEAHRMGMFSMENKTSIPPAMRRATMQEIGINGQMIPIDEYPNGYKNYKDYFEQSHLQATPAPNNMGTRASQRYKLPK